MTARILDGKSIAFQIRKEIAIEVSALFEQRGIQPCLAAILVGDDPASHVYVRNKEIACEKAGIQSRLFRMPSSTTTTELLGLLAQLNSDGKIHGILVQLPLPMQINERQVLDAVWPAKDVDAFAPENVGLISQGRPRYLPCTPHGVMQLLGRCEIETAGKEVVVVGRSDIVGKPLVSMFLQKNGPMGPTNATRSNRNRPLTTRCSNELGFEKNEAQMQVSTKTQSVMTPSPAREFRLPPTRPLQAPASCHRIRFAPRRRSTLASGSCASIRALPVEQPPPDRSAVSRSGGQRVPRH